MTASTEDNHPQPTPASVSAGHSAAPGTTGRARYKENTMYAALLVTIFASTIFFPAFIGIRARTNGNWRQL
jgi:hypothetical protein